jgi:hypothetical protein
MANPILPSQTTAAELEAIRAFYSDQNGQVDYDAIAHDIQVGDASHGQIEDLITTYVLGTGALPDFMMAPEAFIQDPDQVAYLWTDEVTQTLTQLGDLYQGVHDPVQAFETFLNDLRGQSEPDSALAAARDFLDRNAPAMDEGDREEVANEIFDLFNTDDLRDIMSLFIGMGDPGMTLLLYAAYGKAPATQELDEAALEVLQGQEDLRTDIMDDFAAMADDPENPENQFLSQELNQKLSTINTVNSAMTEFIRNAQEGLDRLIQMASQMSDSRSRLNEGIIRNIGS